MNEQRPTGWQSHPPQPNPQQPSGPQGGSGAHGPGFDPPQPPPGYGPPHQFGGPPPGYGPPHQFGGPPPGYGPPHQFGGPPPGYGPPNQWPPGPPAPGKKGLGGWVWLVAAVAVAVVIGTVMYAVSVLQGGPGPVANETPPPPAVPVDTLPPSESTSPTEIPPPAPPHADPGVFLNAAYAEGAEELLVRTDRDIMFVGASPDAGIVAVNVDYEVRGINAATSETVWTYPSYSCSQGTWDGVALCADTADSEAAYKGDIPDVVGLDLATGQPTFRFTPAAMPGSMNFIGQDDVHAYFTIALIKPGFAFGEQNILALTPDGAVAWMTALDTDGLIYSAALVSGNQVSAHAEDSVFMFDRATGAATLNQVAAGSTVDLLWDGWSTYVSGDDKPFKVHDVEGNLVGEFDFTDEFLPGPYGSSAVSVPAYERASLNGGETGARYPWAVTIDGERALQAVGATVYDAESQVLAEKEYLLGISADGALFFTDLKQGTIHDSKTGAVVGGFAESHSPVGPETVDGILFHENFTGEDRGMVILMPGAATG